MIIPINIFKIIEYYLKNRHSLLINAQEELKTMQCDYYAKYGSGIVKFSENKSNKGKPADYAIKLADKEKQISDLILWNKVILKAEDYFKGEKEHILFEGFYKNKIKVTDFAYINNLDKRTIQNYREKVAVYTALIAVEQGLMKL